MKKKIFIVRCGFVSCSLSLSLSRSPSFALSVTGPEFVDEVLHTAESRGTCVLYCEYTVRCNHSTLDSVVR